MSRHANFATMQKNLSDDSSAALTMVTDESSEEFTIAPGIESENTKRVKFDLSQNQAFDDHCCHPLTNYDECWYSSEELQRLKLAAEDEGRQIVEYEESMPHYASTMNAAFSECMKAAEAGGPMSTDRVLSKEQRMVMANWVRNSPNRVGLDRWLLRGLMKIRFQRSRKAMIAIQKAQTMRFRSNEGREKLLRHCMERYSRPCQLFAQCCGEANAQGVET